MRQIESIDIIFENCEVASFKTEHIGAFSLSNITRSIKRIAANSIAEVLECDGLFVQILSRANTLDAYVTKDIFKQTTPPFQRINAFKDITAVDVQYRNGTNDYVLVDWSDEGVDYYNEYQTSKINPYTGDLFLVISKKETVDSYFSKELVENRSQWSFINDLFK